MSGGVRELFFCLSLSTSTSLGILQIFLETSQIPPVLILKLKKKKHPIYVQLWAVDDYTRSAAAAAATRGKKEYFLNDVRF